MELNFQSVVISGYAHPLYAESLAEFGTPRYMPVCGGWILERNIPETDYQDAMGLYPMFFCEKWEGLPGDIESLSDQLIAVSLVIGPFSTIPLDLYQEYFDIFHPYKEHYILDLSLPLEKTVAKGHRRNAGRAIRNLSVEHQVPPDIDSDDWVHLFENLVRRRNIKGIRAFSRACFEKQLSIPGTHYFRVLHNGEVVGGNIFYIQGDVAYAHLSAFSEEGYHLGAPYAVKWFALQYLSSLAHWVNFGGNTSSNSINQAGLDYFKKGWSNQTRKVYFCGKILNKKTYDELVNKTNAAGTNWFPAYRLGIY